MTGRVDETEREERTRNGLLAARAAARLRPPAVADGHELQQRIAEMRAQGMTLQAIADRLNEEGVPTVRGGRSGARRASRPRGYKRPNRSRTRSG